MIETIVETLGSRDRRGDRVFESGPTLAFEMVVGLGDDRDCHGCTAAGKGRLVLDPRFVNQKGPRVWESETCVRPTFVIYLNSFRRPLSLASDLNQ